MLPLLPDMPNVNGLLTRGFWSTLTVSTHSVGPPDTAYVTPASTGNGEPLLKSDGVTPVTGALNVAVTSTSLVVGVVDAVVSVGTGGRSVEWHKDTDAIGQRCAHAALAGGGSEHAGARRTLQREPVVVTGRVLLHDCATVLRHSDREVGVGVATRDRHGQYPLLARPCQSRRVRHTGVARRQAKVRLRDASDGVVEGGSECDGLLADRSPCQALG